MNIFSLIALLSLLAALPFTDDGGHLDPNGRSSTIDGGGAMDPNGQGSGIEQNCYTGCVDPNG